MDLSPVFQQDLNIPVRKPEIPVIKDPERIFFHFTAYPPLSS